MSKEADAKLEPSVRSASREPIAIVGIGCRFPGVNGTEAFWRLLTEEIDAIREAPQDRVEVEGIYDARPGTPGKITSRMGGFLDRVDEFDASFFHISPREALKMDPQQRNLLEVVWEALEDGGQVPEKLSGSATGVFIGACASDYEDIQYYLRSREEIDLYVSTGTSRSVLSGRISYAFDLRGPSMTIDTACSSSLVAVHLACQSLWSSECKLALAGGVNLALLPELTMSFSRAGLIAPGGRCRFGDAGAEGFIRSDGVGAVVLKPLSQALRDGDSIYSIIRGSAANNDGRGSGLLATPSREGQQAVLEQAYLRAGVSPADVQYVEAHGTGTSVGDPIEIESLGAILGRGRQPEDRCLIGSVKGNIGHTEGAAGIAGLIKVALCLKHRMIPRSLHFETPNPKLAWSDLPVEVSSRLVEWPRSRPAIAGVSAFGISGTNAHVVLQEAPRPIEEMTSSNSLYREINLITLSARTQEALVDLARSYRGVALNEEASIHDICYTAAVRRSHHENRLALVIRDREDLTNALDSFLRSEVRPGMSQGRLAADTSHRIVFVFSGQGSQWIGMGRRLLVEPAFRNALERCDAAIKQYANWSVLEEMNADESTSRLDQIDVVQPCLFAIQVALADMWRSFGVEPYAVVGQSMGEVAAAHVAGALSLEDSVKIICGRSLLMKRLSGTGSMLVVGLSLDQALAAIEGYEAVVSIAVSMSPSSTVLSGDRTALDEISRLLDRRGVFNQSVKVDVASHSPIVEPLRKDLLSVLAGIKPSVPSVPIYSTVTGSTEPPVFDEHYWFRNLREPVLFSSAIEQLIRAGADTFIELSPNPVLLTPIQQTVKHLCRSAAGLPSMRCGEHELSVVLSSLGVLYTSGIAVDFESVYPAGRLVPLPAYPWQRERFWLGPESAARRHERVAGASSESIWRWRSSIKSAAHDETYFFEIDLGAELVRRLSDHQVQGAPILPGAIYIDLALFAAGSLFGNRDLVLESLEFQKALFIEEGETETLQLVISGVDEGTYKFQFHRVRSENEDDQSLYAQGMLRIRDQAELPESISIDNIKNRCSLYLDKSDFYHLLAKQGLEYGSGFQGVEHFWSGEYEALGVIALPDLPGLHETPLLRPTLIDISFQILAATISNRLAGNNPTTHLPIGIDRFRLYGDIQEARYSFASLRTDARGSEADQNLLTGDVLILDKHGNVIAEAAGVKMQRLAPSERQARQRLGELIYEMDWKHSALSISEAVASRPDQRGAWLIFADRKGVGEALARLLTSRGEACTVVLASDESRVLGQSEYEIDPSNPADYRLIWEHASLALSPLRGVVHLWSLDSPRDCDLQAMHDEAYRIGCGSLLSLVQSAAEFFDATTFRLWLITSGAQRAGVENTPLSIAQSSLWGLGRVIANEHPELRSTLIDLDSNPTAEDAGRLLTELLENDGETQIALRSGARYVCRLARRPQASKRPAKAIGLRSDGSYIITGGLGGLGLTVAQWMIERGARHLVLAGRSEPSDAASETLDALRKEADILTVRADIGRLGDVADLLAVIDESMPPLRGIVHAAGVLDDRIVLHLDSERFERVTNPKIRGAWNLHRLTLNRELDFFVLFSSAASLLGPAGQGNYSAANAFLDGLAHYRRSLGLHALSIDWGRWSDVGLAARPDRTLRLETRGIRSFTPEEGLRALDSLLTEDSTQAGVMPFDFEHWSEFYPACRELPFFEYVAASKKIESNASIRVQSKLTRQTLLNAESGGRLEQVKSYLGGELACVLGLASTGLKALDFNQPMNRFGVDSLMAVELRNRIEGDLGVVIPVVNFLKGLSPAQLAKQVLDEVEACDAPAEYEEYSAYHLFSDNDQVEEISL